jgi:hypothetical protein
MIPSTRLKRIPLVETMGIANRSHFVKKRGIRKKRKIPKQRANVNVNPIVQELTSFSSSRD